MRRQCGLSETSTPRSSRKARSRPAESSSR
jgi:hypothetical protein